MAHSRFPSAVSVEPRSIETAVAKLAQRQSPRGFVPNHLRCKSLQIRLYGVVIANAMSPPASDPRSLQRRSYRDVMSSAAKTAMVFSVLLSLRDSRAVVRQRPALYPV